MLKVCKNNVLWENVKNPVVTIGSFDGVHRAHKAIIKLLNERAAECGGESVLVSFDPHPRTILGGDNAFKEQFRLLTTPEEKECLLEKSGLQNLLVLHFDEEFAAMSADDFVRKVLVDKLHSSRVIIGYDHNFGHDRAGGFEQICKLGKLYGFEVDRYPEYTLDNEHVSSSQIRKFIKEGRIEEANHILGYHYFIHGEWRQGALELSNEFKMLPAKGNYLVKARLCGRYYYCICNIGDEIKLQDLPMLQEGDVLKVRFFKKIEL